MRARIRGSAGNDGVVVFGEALRFLQALAPAGRAAVPIGDARRLTVEGFDDGLRLHRHFVNRAIAEVDQLFWVSQGKRAATTGVTGVG